MVSKKKTKNPKSFISFQDTILNLQKYWSKKGCVILQPYDLEVGAGTFHPATTLRSLGPKPWKTAYVQPSRRPTAPKVGLSQSSSTNLISCSSCLMPIDERLLRYIFLISFGEGFINT